MASAKNGEQIRLERRTSLYWRVTFDRPPLNIFGPETIPQLNEVVAALETDRLPVIRRAARRAIAALSSLELSSTKITSRLE